jgi:hypothetical protein
MKTNQNHRDFASAGIKKEGMSTLQIREGLIKQGLTNTHANDVVRNQRKRLKVWNLKKELI